MQNRFNILLQERCFESSNLPFKVVDVLVFSLVTLFAVFARISLFPFISNEFTQYMEPWFYIIKQNGGIFGIGEVVGNTTPTYVYVLALLTYLPISPLFSIKIVSCIFDILIAFTVLRIVMGISRSIKISLCAYATILLSPTLMLNSSAWGAYDSIYASLILFCLFSFMKNRPFRGTIFFAIALTIKLQAMFFAPVLIVMWLKNRTRIKYFIAIPLAYILSIIPAFLNGRSLLDLLILYVKTATSGTSLSTNAPNFYYLMGDISPEYVAVMGVFICFAIVIVQLYLLYTKIFRFVPTSVVTISLLFTLTIPYFLPFMNERHFYLAEVLSILLAFARPSSCYIAVLINTASFISYMPNLFGATNINLFYAFLLMTVGLVCVVVDLMVQIQANTAKMIKSNTRQAQPVPQEPAYAAPPPPQAQAPQPRREPVPRPEEVYTPTAEEDFEAEEERTRKGSIPRSAYTLSPEALAKQIPSIADVIEVKPDPIQQLQMENMNIPMPTQPTQPTQQPQPTVPPQQARPPQPQQTRNPQIAQPTKPMASVIPANVYNKQNPYAQPIYTGDVGEVEEEAETNPFLYDEPQNEPQYPLGSSQRLASDKTPPFSLSYKIPRTDGPPPPPPPPVDAAVVPKMTKSEMIAKEMEEPRKSRPIPKQYLQQTGLDDEDEDFIEEKYDEI